MKRSGCRVPPFPYFSLGVVGLILFLACSGPDIIPAGKTARGQVTLSWVEVPGAVSYNIYFDGKSGLTPWTSHKILNASNPITVTDLTLGDTYYFGIAVVGESGESRILVEKSYTVTSEEGSVQFGDFAPVSLNVKGPAQKGPPPQVQAASALDKVPESKEVKSQETKSQAVLELKPAGQATLAWDSVSNAVSYNIYWRESPGVTKRNGNKITNASNPYTLKGLKRGKTYYFVVTAVNKSGESKESEELSFTLKE